MPCIPVCHKYGVVGTMMPDADADADADADG